MIEDMNTMDPDVKRPGLESSLTTIRSSYVAHIPNPQHSANALIFSGPHYQQRTPPPLPSPYCYGIPHDPRALVEHSLVQHSSGYTTPRNGHFSLGLRHARREGALGAPRYPDDHRLQTPQSMSAAVSNGTPHYPKQLESAGRTDHRVGNQLPDPYMNSKICPDLSPHFHGEGASHISPAKHAECEPPMHPGPAFATTPYGDARSQAQIRRKSGKRAQQACDICRLRKAKCDEGRPRCSFCSENDLQCSYQNIAVSTQNDLKALQGDFRAFREDIKSLLSSAVVKRERQSLEFSQDDREKKRIMVQTGSINGIAATRSSAAILRSPSAEDTDLSNAIPDSPLHTSSTAYSGLDHTELNNVSVEHNTAAQKLFRWPSIKRLLEKSRLKESERDENFLMSLELRKKPMRLHCRRQGQEPGESLRISEGVAIPSVSPITSSTSGLSERGLKPTSSTDSSWAYGINLYTKRPRSDSSIEGLNQNMKFDARNIDFLLGKYLTHVHIMHPFLDRTNLIYLMDTFKQRHGLVVSSTSNSSIDALQDSSAAFSRPMKRKALDRQHFIGDAMAISSATTRGSDTSSMLLDRSPTTAMVLLILALGKIYDYREPLPGSVPISTPEEIPHLRRSSSQPGLLAQSVTDSSSFRKSLTSFSRSRADATVLFPSIDLPEQNDRSPRSFVGEMPTQVGNFDVIPGLAYYTQAKDILGSLNSSATLVCVQCCLLAGLYTGQLANSIESLGWIQSAARILMVILKMNEKRKVWPNSVRFAYHTTSQLENDILAEIDFPRVGLENLTGGCFPYPDGYISRVAHSSPVSTQYEQVMQCYSFQLHIRGILNQTQHSLYAPDNDVGKPCKTTIQVLDAFLHEIRDKQMPDTLKWSDDDPPSSNINQARLRGKWYGGLYIVHRPFLRKALELDAEGGLDEYMRRDFERLRSQSKSTGAPPSAGSQDTTLESIIESAKVCIQAAQLSTVAFDGYSDHRRLIVTNILGTAHAQFGNIIVLSAVYCSKHLRQFIAEKPTEKMDFLFKRTIKMLKDLKPISATLGHDQYILECLRETIFRDDNTTCPNALFSSN